MNVGSLNVMKSVNTLQAGVGDTLTYTILIQNTGTVPATNIVFQDPIPSGTVFVANSVTINGVVQQGADPMLGFPGTKYSGRANGYDYVSSYSDECSERWKYKKPIERYCKFSYKSSKPSNNDCYK